MKINWKVRFRNPVFITSLVGFVVATVYQLFGMFEIAPVITEDNVIQTVAQFVNLLTLMGILVDPTTSGIEDSDRALEYEIPN